MTRRQFLSVESVAELAPMRNRGDVIVPVHQVLDTQVNWKPYQLARFEALWSQAVRDLSRCGIRLQTTHGTGVVERPPYREPVVTGLRRGAINFAVTNQIPMSWDGGRALCGITTRYRGHHLCMVALQRAHGHQVPFVSINTCLHELLHALLHDIFEDRPPGPLAEAREFRVDFHATWLWLFHQGGAVREAARKYLERLRSEQNAASQAAAPQRYNTEL